MKVKDFTTILSRFLPYRDNLNYLSLFGFGEPLLDKELSVKIRIAKGFGFNSVGFATNCTELTCATSESLLRAGLDTLICSVDGITKETYESIRKGANFDEVICNIQRFMFIRDMFIREGYRNAKVVIRFVRQQTNEHEWEEFKSRWEKILDPKYGDFVICHDVIDIDGMVDGYKSKSMGVGGDTSVCSEIYNRMSIHSNGEVALCCAEANGKFKLGSVLDSDPIEIFNNETFTHYRRMMEEGRRGELELCNTCTIPRSVKSTTLDIKTPAFRLRKEDDDGR